MHFSKFKSNEAHAIIFHDDRGLYFDDNVQHGNENIDKDKTHLNYSLLDTDETGYSRYKKKLEEVKKSVKDNTGRNIRADAVTLCSWVVTAPKDLNEDKYSDFFRSSYEWLCERYGEDNVINATVHMDETTPHLHFTFMPIVEDEKGYMKLKAKGIETPNSLKYVHRDMQKHLQDELDCPVSLLNGATINGNKTIQQLQGETLQAENERLQAHLDDKKNKALEYDCKPKGLLESKSDYENRVKAHEQAVAVKQREKELDIRENNIDSESDFKARKKALQIVQTQKTRIEQQQEKKIAEQHQLLQQLQLQIQQQQHQIEEQEKQLQYYHKYDSLIHEKNKRDSLNEVASRNNTYTTANNEHYIHKGR